VEFVPEPGAEAASQKAPLGQTPVELTRGSRGGSEVALTFDAGASGDPTRAILKALDDADVKATFFLTGKWCERYPYLVREIVSAGHEIGNHTYDHKDLTKLTDAEIADELKRADEAVYAAAGVHTIGYFRPPLGARNKHVLEVAAQNGYRSAYWSLDSLDSVQAGITSAQIRDRVLGKPAAGDIVLMHCGSEETSRALPEILKGLKARGYRSVRVSELGE
jgi:peptidoglycan/xylan/chitin deacetylase (PgdA/CDA1 family)